MIKYALSTATHKWFVLLACRRAGVPLWRGLIHDLSKFTPAELPHYNRHFFGDQGDPQGFAVALLHHYNHNPHHWEYWQMRSDRSDGASGAVDGYLPMPEKYVREMVADWHGASRAYTGKWEISEWLISNLYTMRLHPVTASRLQKVLEGMGYHLKLGRAKSDCVHAVMQIRHDDGDTIHMLGD